MGYCRSIKSLTSKLSKVFDGTVPKITGKDIQLARELMQGSTEAGKLVRPYTKMIASKIGLKPSAAVTDTSCKRLTRIFEKALTKHDGKLSNVPDVGRLRLLIEKPEDVIAIRQMFLGQNPRHDGRVGVLINSHPSNSIKITEFEDFYHVPSSTGRIGIHITLNITISGKKSIPFEIQVLHKDMVETEDFTRDNYIRAQNIRRQAMKENRGLDPDEQKTVESYDASSRERYTGDALSKKLYNLRRKDLIQKDAVQHLKLVA